MKTSFKILVKIGLLFLFIFISPLMQGIQATVKELDLSLVLFNQQKSISPIDIEAFNVMDMVKKEDIPYREIDIEQPEKVAEVPLNNQEQKSIYIYSTHQKEAYKDQNSVMEASRYLGNLLTEAGYQVVIEERDFTQELNAQGLDYNQSYQISRNAINDALIKYQGFDLMIDFHRDSVPRSASFIERDGKSFAKMMIVLGGLSPHFSLIQNKAVTLLDKTNQIQNGIMKNILIREAYYNQDISEKMLLIEVGSEENYYQEVTNSLDILAQSIHEMMR